MQSSLYTGVSGLNANMSELSVIGNNIANVNTVGFKSSSVSFEDILSQTVTGNNQIGLGVQMSAITKSFTQGAFETTGNNLDLAISGNGFFIVEDAELGMTYYTRDGQFSVDKDGYLVNADGLRLQGYMASSTGTLQNTIQDLVLSTDTIEPNPSTTATINANLDSNSAITGYVFATGSNDTIDFSVDGGTTWITASLITDGGLADGSAYTGDEVSAAIKTAIESTNGNTDTYEVTYDDQTGFYTIENTGASSLDIDWTTSATSAGAVLGFTIDSSIAVAASASSDVAGGAFDLDNAGDTSNFSTPVTVYDSLGNDHVVTLYFRKDSKSATGNEWEWYAVVDGTDTVTGSTEVQASGTVSFTTGGALNLESAATYWNVSGGFDFTGGSAEGQIIGFDFGESITQGGTGTDGTTQYGTTSGVSLLTQDGYASGSLQSTSIDQDGIITGIFSNGRDLTLGQVLVADFANQTALSNAGSNLYVATFDSGQALIGSPGSSGRGLVQSSTVELSNVDIAQEFVNMITAQRGFQASSKIITTTDEILAELVNLKR